MIDGIDTATLDIPHQYILSWQRIVDTLAIIIDVPAALIMKFTEPYLEVFVSSNTDENNPYIVGEKEKKSGLYCEKVIDTQKKLSIPNAIKQIEWKNNPDIKLGMINYLGYPISWPDGTPFGTICVLDRKERIYKNEYENLLREFSYMVNNYLTIIYENEVKNMQKREIAKLESMLSICAYCKKIKGKNENTWIDMETYIRTSNISTHVICTDCYNTEMNKLNNKDQ